jgi:hypothetical protein
MKIGNIAIFKDWLRSSIGYVIPFRKHGRPNDRYPFVEIAPTAVLIALTISAINALQAEPLANVAIKNQSVRVIDSVA